MLKLHKLKKNLLYNFCMPRKISVYFKWKLVSSKFTKYRIYCLIWNIQLITTEIRSLFVQRFSLKLYFYFGILWSVFFFNFLTNNRSNFLVYCTHGDNNQIKLLKFEEIQHTSHSMLISEQYNCINSMLFFICVINKKYSNGNHLSGTIHFSRMYYNKYWKEMCSILEETTIEIRVFCALSQCNIVRTSIPSLTG